MLDITLKIASSADADLAARILAAVADTWNGEPQSAPATSARTRKRAPAAPVDPVAAYNAIAGAAAASHVINVDS